MEPFEDELPSQFANRLGKEYAQLRKLEEKRKGGQFFTPFQIASYMASLSTSHKEAISILDPGAGIGILSCAICEFLSIKGKTREIHLTVYEIDCGIIPFLNRSLSYLKRWLSSKGIKININCEYKDFILENYYSLNEKEIKKLIYDIVISNPPYFKLSKTAAISKATSSIISGQPNIYFLFMAIGASLLKPDGEFLFITPRSFTSGKYFQKFREYFLSLMNIELLHVFDSRKKVFEEKVLQESIIIKSRRKKTGSRTKKYIKLSYSEGYLDILYSIQVSKPFNEIINLSSDDKTIAVPIGNYKEQFLKKVATWNGNLNSFGWKVSTGRVVPFRATDYLRRRGKLSDGYAPLIWLQNVKSMHLAWPISNGKLKQQYFRITPNSNKLLVEDCNYILLRRFSPKENALRLVAAPLIKNTIGCKFIAIENHINYIYKVKRSLTINEAYGFASILNSIIFDTYFRVISGSTQVNANDLRQMRLPNIHIIRDIGRRVRKAINEGHEINDIVVQNLLKK